MQTLTLHDLPHVTPIACPKCLMGKAHLVQCGPNAFRHDGQSEIWVFKCDRCGEEYVQAVES